VPIKIASKLPRFSGFMDLKICLNRNLKYGSRRPSSGKSVIAENCFLQAEAHMAEDFTVTPYEVTGDIDYQELMTRFGTKAIDSELISKLEKFGEIHPMLRRQIVYSHRDFDWILDRYEKGEKFILYTGRGPSGPVHLGHLMPWAFTKYLQDIFDVRLYFQLTDDEKFMFYDDLTLDKAKKWGYENALDVIAMGFKKELTRIFLDTELIKTMYPIAIRAAKKINFSTVRAVFGFNNSFNIGSIFFTSIQTVPAFLESHLEGKNVPCLIPCGIDQDPHFRITRDIAEGLGYYKPALIHAKLMPSLAGSDKMSSSKMDTTIWTTDSPKDVKKKISNAFTGGATSVEEQRRDGGKPDICSVFQYNQYFFLPDDKALNDLREKCRSGEILCGECKGHLTERVTAFLEKHQERREKAKDIIEDFMFRD